MIGTPDMRDAQSLLLRALRRHGAPLPDLRTAHSEAWASATFAGARHRFAFAPAAPACADALASTIGSAEFALPGHLVADIVVASRAVSRDGIALTIEALTVEDG
jgi:hypothetical protein